MIWNTILYFDKFIYLGLDELSEFHKMTINVLFLNHPTLLIFYLFDQMQCCYLRTKLPVIYLKFCQRKRCSFAAIQHLLVGVFFRT